MPRTKSIAARRHRKIKKLAKGYKHSAGRRVKTSKEAVLHAGAYSYSGRKKRRRDARKLWIIRLNAAAREHDLTYSTLMAGLKAANIELDRKILSDLAVSDPKAFTDIAKQAQDALAKDAHATSK